MSEKVTAETTVSTTELACVIGVTARRVQQMTQDGTLPTVSRGKFNLSNCVQRYITFISSDQISEDEKKVEKGRRIAEAQIKTAKATVASMEANELKGKMHRSEDVAAMTTDLIFAIRGMLLALPGRLAVDVSMTTDPAEIANIIKNEVYKVMDELSHYRYDAAKYEERVRDRQNWDRKASGDDDQEE